MADNNLNVDIIADSTKARVELELFNAKLTASRKEVRLFREEANKTGDTTKLTKAVAETERLEKATASLRKETHRARQESEGFFEGIEHAAHGNRPIARLFREFSSLNSSIENTAVILGRFTGGLAGGLAAMAAFKGFEFLRDTINEVSKELGELKKAAGNLNLKPIEVQGAQRAVGAIGEEADVATKALEGMNAQIEELRKHPPGAGSIGAGSAFGVQVSRGGQPTPSDFSKPLQMLGIEAQVAAVGSSRRPGANLQAVMLELRAFQQQARNFNATDLNIISKTLFGGVPANSMLKVAPTLLKNWQEEIEKLAQSSAGATNKVIDDDEKLRISINKRTEAWKDLSAAMASGLQSPLIHFNELIAIALDKIAKLPKTLPDARAARAAGLADPTSIISEPFGGGIMDPAKGPVPAIKTQFTPLINFFQGLTKDIGKTWVDLWKRIGAGAQQAKMSLETSLPGLPQAFRGSGRGVDDSHGPVMGGAGYGPGSRATQSITPGLSDYQAPTPNVISPLLSGFGELAESSKSAAEAVADLAASSRSAAAASALAVNASVNPSATAESPTSTGFGPGGMGGFARGGFVRGPGSGTSDSILARLSAGEFVVNSARVRQVGLGFLQRLNGFADGGFVGPGPLRFAGGGLVPSAGGGRAVHLHLGSSSFALSGHDSVVEALVSAAHSQQIRSAGVKPSWFAARPGG